MAEVAAGFVEVRAVFDRSVTHHWQAVDRVMQLGDIEPVALREFGQMPAHLANRDSGCYHEDIGTLGEHARCGSLGTAANKTLASAATLLMGGKVTRNLFFGDIRTDLFADLANAVAEQLPSHFEWNFLRVVKRIKHCSLLALARHDHRFIARSEEHTSELQ